jgi:hypothetical protein
MTRTTINKSIRLAIRKARYAKETRQYRLYGETIRAIHSLLRLRRNEKDYIV